MSLAMRNEVPVELTWDLSLIYPTEEAMYRDVEKMKALCASMEERFKGKLTTPEAICDCLNDLQEMTRLMTLTGNYTDLAVSVDYYDSHNQERNDRVMNIISDINTFASDMLSLSAIFCLDKPSACNLSMAVAVSLS